MNTDKIGAFDVERIATVFDDQAAIAVVTLRFGTAKYFANVFSEGPFRPRGFAGDDFVADGPSSFEEHPPITRAVDRQRAAAKGTETERVKDMICSYKIYEPRLACPLR